MPGVRAGRSYLLRLAQDVEMLKRVVMESGLMPITAFGSWQAAPPVQIVEKVVEKVVKVPEIIEVRTLESEEVFQKFQRQIEEKERVIENLQGRILEFEAKLEVVMAEKDEKLRCQSNVVNEAALQEIIKVATDAGAAAASQRLAKEHTKHVEKAVKEATFNVSEKLQEKIVQLEAQLNDLFDENVRLANALMGQDEGAQEQDDAAEDHDIQANPKEKGKRKKKRAAKG